MTCQECAVCLRGTSPVQTREKQDGMVINRVNEKLETKRVADACIDIHLQTEREKERERVRERERENQKPERSREREREKARERNERQTVTLRAAERK